MPDTCPICGCGAMMDERRTDRRDLGDECLACTVGMMDDTWLDISGTQDCTDCGYWEELVVANNGTIVAVGHEIEEVEG